MPRGSREERDREHAAYIKRLRDATRVHNLVGRSIDLEGAIKSGNVDHVEIVPTKELDNMMFTRMRVSQEDSTMYKVPKRWEGPKGKYYEILMAIVNPSGEEGTVTIGQIRERFGNHDASTGIVQAHQQGLIKLEGEEGIRETIVRL